MFSKVKRFNDAQKESSLGQYHIHPKSTLLLAFVYPYTIQHLHRAWLLRGQRQGHQESSIFQRLVSTIYSPAVPNRLRISSGIVQSSSDRFKENADTANLGPGEYEGSRVGRKSLGVRASMKVHAKPGETTTKPALKNRRKTLAAVPQPAVLEPEIDRVRRRLRQALASVENGNREIEVLKGDAAKKDALLLRRADQLTSLEARYLAEKCSSKAALECERDHVSFLEAALDEKQATNDELRFERESLKWDKNQFVDEQIDLALEDRIGTEEMLVSALEELGRGKASAEEELRLVHHRRAFTDLVRRYYWFSSLKSLCVSFKQIAHDLCTNACPDSSDVTLDSSPSTWLSEYRSTETVVTLLGEHISELKSTYNSQSEEFADIKAECQKLKQELHNCNTDLAESEERLAQLKLERIEVEQKLDEEIQVKSVSLEGVREELSQMTAENYFKSNAMANFKRELDEQTQAMAQLNSAMRRQSENHSAEVAALESTHAEAVEYAYDLECEKEDLIVRTTQLTDDLGAMMQSESKQAEENLRLRDGLIQAQEEVVKLKEGIDSMKARRSSLERENADNLANLEEHQKQLKRMQIEHKQTKQIKHVIEQELATLKEQALVLTKRNSDLASGARSSATAIQSIRADANRKDDALKAAKAELNRLKADYASLQGSLDKAVEAEEKVTKKLRCSVSSTKKYESENRALKQELGHLKSSRSAFEARLQEEITEISSKCQEWKSQCDMTKERFIRLQEEYRSVKGATADLQQTRDENHKLNVKVGQMQQTIQELTDDLKQVYDGGAFTCTHCEKRLDAEGQEMVAKALKGRLYLQRYRPKLVLI